VRDWHDPVRCLGCLCPCHREWDYRYRQVMPISPSRDLHNPPLE
jgi:hypothetical protein